MKIAQITIEGEKITGIIDLLLEQVEDYHNYKAGKFTVLIKEDWPSCSGAVHLMSVYIFNFTLENMVEIEIVTGGAHDDILFHWSHENSENCKFVRTLKAVCTENAWVVTKVHPAELEKLTLADKLIGGCMDIEPTNTSNPFLDKFSVIFFGDDKKDAKK